MNIDLRHVLRTISPVAVQEWLRSRGWLLKEDLSAQQGVVIYERDGVFLDVPLHVDYGDYPRRVEEVLGPLARVEGISPLELVDELVASDRQAPTITR